MPTTNRKAKANEPGPPRKLPICAPDLLSSYRTLPSASTRRPWIFPRPRILRSFRLFAIQLEQPPVKVDVTMRLNFILKKTSVHAGKKAVLNWLWKVRSTCLKWLLNRSPQIRSNKQKSLFGWLEKPATLWTKPMLCNGFVRHSTAVSYLELKCFPRSLKPFCETISLQEIRLKSMQKTEARMMKPRVTSAQTIAPRVRTSPAKVAADVRLTSSKEIDSERQSFTLSSKAMPSYRRSRPWSRASRSWST